jgi:phage tail sheath gpL-like
LEVFMFLAQKRVLLPLLGLAAASPSFAAIDTTAIEAAATDVGVIGLAVFGIMVAIAVWKWVRRTL